MKKKIAFHLNYIGLAAPEAEILREARPLLVHHSEPCIERFYAHLRKFEGTTPFLKDEAVVKRLLAAQRVYLASVFEARFDEDYYLHRQRIGQTHFRIGLDFKWYVGSYSLYLEYFMPVLRQQFPNDIEKSELLRSAFSKVMLMDMSIVLDAYHECDKAALEASKTQVTHQEKLATVGLLASGLAHEIGNPLASIQAVCDNQIRKNPEPAVAEKFQRIRNQVGRIVDIVRKLVDYARPTPEATNLVNLNDEIMSALEIAQLSRKTKDLNIELQLDPEMPAIPVIDGQMSQVFLNLILNAIDAMQSAGGKLTLRSQRFQPVSGSQRVRIEIRDTGCGIPKENLDRIFDPFFTTKDVGKGTGLGLHVSRGIIENHGGIIGVASVPGEGSVFSIEMPVSHKIPGASADSNPDSEKERNVS